MNAGDATHCFMDTNVWLYALIMGQDVQKTVVAKKVLRENRPVVSTQIINEVCVNLIRKAEFSEEKVQRLIRSFYGKYRVLELDRNVLLKASEMRGRYSFSFWDSVVVSSALCSGTSILYSEDMQDGLEVDGRLTIVNPFAVSA